MRPRKKRAVCVAITPSAGSWVGFVPVGAKPDGSPDRRKRSSKMCAACRQAPRQGCSCWDACADKIRDLEDRVAANRVTKPGRAPTLARYLADWLANGERAGKWRYNTIIDYAMVVRLYLVPRLGGHRIDALAPEHVRRMEDDVRHSVSAHAAAKAHRVLRTALADAVRAEILHRNVAKLVQPPTVTEDEIQPLTVAEARRILDEASTRRNAARWLVALSMGLRQGEALGLAWHRRDKPRLAADVDLDAGTMTVREKVFRKRWRHGCADPHACAATRPDERRPGEFLPSLHRTKPCRPPWRHGCADPGACRAQAWRCPERAPGVCSQHRRPCPAPCPPGCVEHARACPQRRDGGLFTEPPKSRAGDRVAAMPEPVRRAMLARKTEQDDERDRAGELWTETGLIFTTALGAAIDPKADYDEWCDILRCAGVPHARLHDARHTCATFLLAQGVDKRTAMKIMGWSQASMADRYQHPASEMLRDAADRVGALLWPQPGPDPAPEPGPARTPAGSANDLATVTDLRSFRSRRKAV